MPRRRGYPLALLLAVTVTPLRSPGQAVRAVGRQDAIEAAVARGARALQAQADAALVRAGRLVAASRSNPVLTSEYTKDSPQFHHTIELPLDLPWQRSRRIRAATQMEVSAGYRLQLERALAALDADTTYTRALWREGRVALSTANLMAADSLLRMARTRRDAGDASELEVQLAEVAAGQQANVVAADSLEAQSARLDLMALMGLDPAGGVVALSDTLGDPGDSATPAFSGTPLTVAAAEQALRAADMTVSLERSAVWQPPSVVLGAEHRDPLGDAKGLLPVAGLSIPLPVLNRNRASIAVAEAVRERARAELTLARVESALERARVVRDVENARGRLVRDRALLAGAERVASMSLIAYREGAAALPAVLEAQRSAREVRVQYLDDLAAVWIARARVRTLLLTMR